MAYHAMVAEQMHHTNEMIARPLGMFLLHSIKILQFENVVSDRGTGYQTQESHKYITERIENQLKFEMV